MFDPPLTLIDGKFPKSTFFVPESDRSVAGLSHLVVLRMVKKHLWRQSDAEFEPVALYWCEGIRQSKFC